MHLILDFFRAQIFFFMNLCKRYSKFGIYKIFKMLPLLVSMEKYEHEKAVQIDCIIHSGGMEIHKSMSE